jgi:hypothetical protein
MRTTVKAISAAAVAAALGGGLAACSTGSVTKAAPPAKTSAPAPATTVPASTTAAPTPSDPNSGPVGTTFNVTGTDNQGNDTKYSVTVVKLVEPASASDEFNTASSGHHLAGAEVQVTGITGQSTDDAFSTMSTQGSDEQTYDSSIVNTLAAGDTFNGGVFHVGPGQQQIGWVPFEVKDGVHVASVQWTASSGFSDSVATWTVAGTPLAAAPAPAPATPQAPAASQKAPQAPAPAPTQPAASSSANAEAVVTQFFQDINNHDYRAAWALGGDNLSGGTGYDKWVAGYATTTWNTLGTLVSSGPGVVAFTLSATHTDGTTGTYQGTYTVQNSVIVSGDVRQTS